MAHRFGIDRGHISDLERGKKSVCLPLLEVLSKGFGVTVSELMRGVGRSEPQRLGHLGRIARPASSLEDRWKLNCKPLEQFWPPALGFSTPTAKELPQAILPHVAADLL